MRHCRAENLGSDLGQGFCSRSALRGTTDATSGATWGYEQETVSRHTENRSSDPKFSEIGQGYYYGAPLSDDLKKGMPTLLVRDQS
jgi:hypothetical protein